EDYGIGGKYNLNLLIQDIKNYDDLLHTVFFLPFGLLWYLVEYLSITTIKSFNLVSKILTILSLLWFIFSLSRYKTFCKKWQESSFLAAMFFVICLGVTTGIGRGYMGDLSYGVRFYPIVLLYWTSFFLHTAIYFLSNKKINIFWGVNIFCFVILFSVFIFDSIKI